MAHQLSGIGTFKLHQALHGYADGHRQLALSTTLKVRDQKALLALSDISGPGAKLDESGYLTGYPLSESALFALARTWPAPEMPRPGCVWTHTLLVDLADLAVMASLNELVTLFRRPLSADDLQSYREPKKVEMVPKADQLFGGQDWTRRVLAALYGQPTSRIIAADPGPGAERAILALWSQQWPRLRRSFRFCTFAPGDRSTESAAFDLQVVPALDRGLRSRFGNAVEAEVVDIDPAPWIELAIRDLSHPDVDGLRSFLRHLGSDVGSGREAFRPLCQLHQAIKVIGSRPEAVHDAIAIVQDELGPKEARSARTAVAGAALKRADVLDDRSFDFLWSHLALLEADELKTNAGKVGCAAWRRDPALLVTASIDDVLLEAIVNRTLDQLAPKELIDGLRTVPVLAERALARRQELVELSDFWGHFDLVDHGFRAATTSGRQRAAITAILAAGRGDLMPRASSVFGAKDVMAALKGVPDANAASVADWLRAAAKDTNSVADFLATEHGIHQAVLLVLARILPPDAVPNDFGEDSWLTAWRNSNGAIDEGEALYLAAYFLARALGHRSRSQGDLAQLSFEKVHRAAEADLLPQDAWRLVEPRLPWADFWFAWDHCERLRAGVVTLFVDRDLPAETFARLAEDAELFVTLANRAARTGRGRAYLRQVERSVKDNGGPTVSALLSTLEKLLD